ncbi:MAG: DNA-methyltransferase [Armatimonadota bacterium]
MSALRNTDLVYCDLGDDEPVLAPGQAYSILQGSTLEVLRGMPDQVFQTCITSPPYWNLRAYLDSDDPLKKHELGCEEVHDCLGWATGEKCRECYICHMVEVFTEVYRVLRDDGTFWLNVGDSYNGSGKAGKNPEYQERHKEFGKVSTHTQRFGKPTNLKTLKKKELCGIPWRLAFALQSAGWYLRSDIIWHKPNPMPVPVRDRCTSAHEYVFMLTKSPQYLYDLHAIKEPFADSRQGKDGSKKKSERNVGGRRDGFTTPNGIDPSANGGKNKRDVWSIPTKGLRGEHFAVMPEALVEPCVLAGSSEWTCDICGSPYARVVKHGNSEHHCRPGCGCKEQHAGEQDWSEGWKGYGGYESTAVVTNDFEPTCLCADRSLTIVDSSIVLDPFCGAATVGISALRQRRRFVGIELNPLFIALSERRIRREFNCVFDYRVRSEEEL